MRTKSRVASAILPTAGACASAMALTAILHSPLVEGLIGGALAALIVYWQESRLRELSAGLRQLESAKHQFLANVSHEIRTPLNAIETTAELLARGDLPPEQRRMASLIQTSCESLAGMLNEVLDAARLETGQLRIEIAAFDLASAIDSVTQRMAARAREKGLAFEVDVAPGLPARVESDPQRLRQILAYLLDNAVKFTTSGKVRLEVSAVDKPAAALLFRVIDTGPGIDPVAAAVLVQPFTQGDSTAARSHSGVGLGLTLVYRLVNLMGGSVGVESTRGGGSTFWFVLPAKGVVDEPRLTVRPGHILIVDDNPVNQMVAARAVHNLGCTSQVVSGGEAALEALSHGGFNLVLMDCQMPVLDGYQSTRLIRQREAALNRGGRIPVVAMTANALAGEHELCIEAGMDDYLTKPIRMASLARTIERWVPAAKKENAAPVAVAPD